jgi:hypothetical protein
MVLILRQVENKLFFYNFIHENKPVKMNQNRSSLFLLVIFFFGIMFSSCSIIQPRNSYAGSNTGNPMEPTRQINRVYPARHNTKRYLDSNKKKKRKWTKIRQIYGFDCPWDKSYTSKSHKKIECRLRWRKAKLRREIRRNK